MTYLRYFATATIVLLAVDAHAQQIDYTCLNRCTQSGYVYQYCSEVCSYGSPPPLYQPPPVSQPQAQSTPRVDPQYFDWGRSFNEGYERAEQRRRQQEQAELQRQQAEAQRQLLDEQRRAVELENRRREAELREPPPTAGQGPSDLRQQEILRKWESAAGYRRNFYADFDEVVLAPDVNITLQMIELMASSPFAADIAYYLGKNKAEAARIARLPLLEQASAIRDIEQRITADFR